MYGYVFVFLLFILGGFRDISIGADTSWYYYNWLFTDFDPKTWNHYTPFEPGFNILIAFIKRYFSNSYYFFYSFVFFVTYLLFILYAKLNRLNVVLFFSLIYISSNWAQSINIMRQYLGLSFAILALSVLDGKSKTRILIYELLIFAISFSVHSSIMILSVFPLFMQKKVLDFLTTRTLFIILILSVLVSVWGNNIVISFLPYFEGLFGNRQDTYIGYYIENGLGERQVGYLGPILSTSILIILSRKYRDAFIDLAVIGFCLTLISTSFFSVIGRVFLNLNFLGLIYLARIWKSITKDRYQIILAMFLVVYYLINMLGIVINSADYNPYKNYLFRL